MAKKQTAIERSKLVQALEFLCLTWRATNDQTMYCTMSNFQAVSFNSVIAAGIAIDCDLEACPHSDLLLTALLRCADRYTITQLSPEKLLVRSEGPEEFQAYIPCLRPETLSRAVPDAAIVEIDDHLIEALLKVVPLVSATAETVVECSVQLNNGSCLATNRTVIMEAWHGLNLPNGLLLPKQAVAAIRHADKPLKAFGYSPHTATFYFADGSWLRTQLFDTVWPNVKSQLDSLAATRPVPPELFKAAKKVAAFSIDGFVYIKDGLISSHPFTVKEEGSVLRIPIGSPHQERVYSIKNLALVAKHVIGWNETARVDGTYFTGESLRGLISHQVPHEVYEAEDDIPF
jgi:hypothetical protein